MRRTLLAAAVLMAVSSAAWGQACDGPMTAEAVAKETGTPLAKFMETEELAIQGGQLDRRTFRCAMLRMKTAFDLINQVNKPTADKPSGQEIPWPHGSLPTERGTVVIQRGNQSVIKDFRGQ